MTNEEIRERLEGYLKKYPGLSDWSTSAMIALTLSRLLEEITKQGQVKVVGNKVAVRQSGTHAMPGTYDV